MDPLLATTTPSTSELSLAVVLVMGLVSLPLLFLLVILLYRMRNRSMDRILRRMDDREEAVDHRDAWVESGRRFGGPDAQGYPSSQDGEDED